jgi:V-type H+-transporting ATPase subunit E
MDDEEVQKQLDHMVKFIYREADEKANEIKAKAQEEFSIEKSKIVQDEKLKIAAEFERKEKQLEIKKKIAFSNELNLSRLRTLRAHEEGVQKLLNNAHRLLVDISKDKESYKALLQKLIVQGLMKLQEANVELVCRAEDVNLVSAVLPDSVAEYKKRTKQECTVLISKEIFLPSGSGDASKGDLCSGGIILSSNDGKIICSNTLDARLAMTFEQNLPKIRTIIYGKSLTRKHLD